MEPPSRALWRFMRPDLERRRVLAIRIPFRIELGKGKLHMMRLVRVDGYDDLGSNSLCEY
jgi:hypothetical protein